jgi:PAS domain S-box-containing protein
MMPQRIFDRKTAFTIVLVIGFLLTNGWFAFRNVRQLYADTKWVAHTHEVLETLHSISWLLAGAESGQRGYILTGEPSFLEPYQTAVSSLNEQIKTLNYLTADNPQQQERISALRAAINNRFKILHENLSLRTERNLNAARKSALMNRGKAEMDRVRGLLDEMMDAEKQLLKTRSERSELVYQNALLMNLLAGLFCLAAVLGLVIVVRRDLAARQASARIIYQERELFRITLASIGDGVITTDTAGRVTYLNSIAQTLTGWSNKEAHGQPLEVIFNVMDEKTGKPIANPVTKALNFGIMIGLANHTMLIRKDGSRRPIEDSAAPIKDREGGIKGVVLTFKDVTESRRSKEELRQSVQRYRRLAEELANSNRDLEQFAYVASHDLQEPLHVVTSFADLLSIRCDKKLDPKEKEYIDFIKQAANQARRLVKELLEYSRIGKSNQSQMIDIKMVLEEVKFNLRLPIEESKAEIITDGLPTIQAAHSEIVQLFQNLISNAIKYQTPDVPPRIVITWSKLNNMYLFSVKDNGIGIEQQYKERIFEMFQRLHSPDSSGTGIGLAICKKIVEQHGGKIWMESEPGKGSIFYFTLRAF